MGRWGVGGRGDGGVGGGGGGGRGRGGGVGVGGGGGGDVWGAGDRGEVTVTEAGWDRDRAA